MTITIYKGNDTGAPTLDGYAGSLRALLKACLVDGYGTKPAAGWTVALDDAGNHKIIFRNNATTGTGRYFRLQDDGYIYSGHGGGEYRHATMRGCESYTDIDTTAGNFPNLGQQGDANPDDSDHYGISFIKCNGNNNAGPWAWMVIADDRTCYILIHYYNVGYTDVFDPYFTATVGSRNFIAFGDFNPLNGITDAYAAMVIGNGFETSMYNYFSRFGEGAYNDYQNKGHYLNRGIDGNPGAVEFSKVPLLRANAKEYIGGYSSSTTAGIYEPYPSPVSGGVIKSPIMIREYTNAVERTVRHTYYEGGIRGSIRGIYSCPHSLNPAVTDNLGENGDTLTIDGRSYMCLLVGDSTANISVLVDTTGPW